MYRYDNDLRTKLADLRTRTVQLDLNVDSLLCVIHPLKLCF